MIGRMELATQPLAQSAADRLHSWMRANNSEYNRSANAGRTTAWCIPYQDGAVWCVHVKDRADPGMTVPERTALKPIPPR